MWSLHDKPIRMTLTQALTLILILTLTLNPDPNLDPDPDSTTVVGLKIAVYDRILDASGFPLTLALTLNPSP